MASGPESAEPRRPETPEPRHRWRFFRAGGFDQVRIETGEDLKNLAQLDQKLWLALSCPVDSVQFEQRTLELMDTDRDGRIRALELLEAVRWTCAMVNDADALFAGHGSLPLSLIDDRHEDGARLLASAKRILTNLGKPDAAVIAPDEAADVQRIFAKTTLNGDGIVPASAANDPSTAAVIAEIKTLAGSRPDRGGEPGIGKEEADAFFAAVDAYCAWWDEAQASPDILPLGEGTLAAVQAVDAIRAKLDDYFFRCRMAAFDPAAAAALNADAEDFAAIADQDLSGGAAPVAGFPLARVAAGRALPLGDDGINPAWAAKIAALRDAAVTPLLGARDALSEDDWQALQARLKPGMAWLAAKQGGLVEPLGLGRVREIKAGAARRNIAALIEADLALKPEFEAIAAVEMLARYVRDLVPLLHNFVSFRDFYTRKGRAIFQVGQLYIDGRSCDLCVRVDDPARHATLASLSRIYLLYCDCYRRGPTNESKTGEKMTIVAGITGGDGDQLMAGRNGVFYDREGRDWDAVVVKIVSHPISIREAFWLPYKKLGKFIGEQVEKFAAARAKQSEAQMTTQLLQTGAQVASGKAPPPPPPPAFDAGKFAGIFAAIGLAIGAIGTALASVVTGILNLTWWQVPLALAGVILLISGPSMVIAAMKLRQRNLAPILDANGWAVNARAKINIPFGGSLTQLAKLPPGAERALTDPYAERTTPWRLIAILVLIVILLGFAWRYDWLPRLFGH